MSQTATSDGPMHRKTVDEMSDAELDATIQAIRERRQAVVRVYQEAQEAKRLHQEELAREQYGRQLQLFEKDLATVDRALDRLETRANKLRALRLQWE